MSGPPGHHTPDRHNIMARLDAALASPRGPRPVSPNVRQQQQHQPEPQQDQIYAPVAALQQKIQQQQQARMAQQAGHHDPGLMPHPPGPQLNQSTFASPKAKQPSQGHPDASETEYGFGMQFQVQSQNFYQNKQQHPHYPPQHPHQPLSLIHI